MIEQVTQEGTGTQALAKAIRDQFTLDSRTRSLRIARTELTDVINDGTGQTLAKEGHQTKAWSTVLDGQERESHHAANGQTVGIHESFNIGGAYAQYPGDSQLPPESRINCRCTLVGGDVPEDRRRILNDHFLRIHGTLENKFVVSLRKAFLAQRDRVLSRLS